MTPLVSTPLVSFIVPAHNAQHYLPATIESLRAQTHRAIEILVVDDGSTDQTAEIVKRLAQRDDRVRLITQPQSGVAAARNRGLQAAQGEWVAPVDADDIWHAESAEKMLRRALSQPDVVVVYAWSACIDESGRLLNSRLASTIDGRVTATLVCHNFIGNASATLIRRSALVDVGGYDPQFHHDGRHGCDDWDCYLRLAERGRFAVVPEFLVGYRKRDQSMSSDGRRMYESQQAMLGKWYQQHPAAPSWLGRWSRTSFLIYLAREARRRGDAEAHRTFILMAWSVSPWMSLVRPAWHANRWRGTARVSPGVNGRAGAVPVDADQRFEPPRLNLADRCALGSKIAVQRMFHRVVSMLTRGAGV